MRDLFGRSVRVSLDESGTLLATRLGESVSRFAGFAAITCLNDVLDGNRHVYDMTRLGRHTPSSGSHPSVQVAGCALWWQIRASNIHVIPRRLPSVIILFLASPQANLD